jgi:hypothetical protein
MTNLAAVPVAGTVDDCVAGLHEVAVVGAQVICSIRPSTARLAAGVALVVPRCPVLDGGRATASATADAKVRVELLVRPRAELWVGTRVCCSTAGGQALLVVAHLREGVPTAPASQLRRGDPARES